MKKLIWIVLGICVLAGIGYVGSTYFNGFNNMYNNMNCKTDCYENGVRVR